MNTRNPVIAKTIPCIDPDQEFPYLFPWSRAAQANRPTLEPEYAKSPPFSLVFYEVMSSQTAASRS